MAYVGVECILLGMSYKAQLAAKFKLVQYVCLPMLGYMHVYSKKQNVKVIVDSVQAISQSAQVYPPDCRYTERAHDAHFHTTSQTFYCNLN